MQNFFSFIKLKGIVTNTCFVVLKIMFLAKNSISGRNLFKPKIL